MADPSPGPACPEGAAGWPVLTVRQPWAFGIEHGKSPENRGWEMKYRGPLWLHAGSRVRWDPAGEGNPLILRAWKEHSRAQNRAVPPLVRSTEWMTFGAVTALVDVTGCHHAYRCEEYPGGRRPPRWCTPWAAGGQFHIQLEVRHLLAEPVPCRGWPGRWRLEPADEAAALAQVHDVNATPALDTGGSWRSGRCEQWLEGRRLAEGPALP